MIPPKLFVPDAAAGVATTQAVPVEGAFGKPFWFTYASNLSMMTAVSSLFRYSDFVKLLDGAEWQLGLIVGVGMVGSLLMRFAQGVGIDRIGARHIWLLSSGLFVASCLGHMLITTLDGPAIYVLRILYQISLAGFFGASITFISGRSPLARVAEVVGSLGSSGFVGMAIGSTFSDLLLGAGPVDRWHVNQVFLFAAGMGCAALLFAGLATRGFTPPKPRRRVPIVAVLRRYHPGPVLIVAIAMGFGLSLPPIFLRPFVASLDVNDIRVFFYVYTLTAFVTRVSIRRLPERLGVRRMVFIGLGALVTSMLLFLTVSREWQLMWPGMTFGVAHAFLFPAVVAAGSAGFPARYRGLGTTFILALFDFGNLVGSPSVGGIVDAAPLWNLPGFPTMFVTVAVILTAIGLTYALIDRGDRHDMRSGRITRVRRRSTRRAVRMAAAG